MHPRVCPAIDTRRSMHSRLSDAPVCLVPLRLTVDAAGRIRQRLEALRGDFLRAVLANSIAAFGDASPRVLRLDRVLVEDAMDRVGGGSVRDDLSLVRSPESFAHCYAARLIPIARKRLFSESKANCKISLSVWP